MIITDIEKKNLIDEMAKLLDEYDYAYDRWALGLIIDKWADQKADLINAFKRHPNYLDGKFMIVFDYNYEREFDKNAVRNFGNWLNYEAMPWGKDTLPDDIMKQKEEPCYYLPDKLYWFINDLSSWITSKTISEDVAKKLDSLLPQIHPHVGEKSSRVINKLCTYLGYNKHPGYNREYAKFADGLSPIVIKRHTILSINPLDYLTMSFGNSWASCHTIDKYNKRNMPNSYEGQYSSGTMSYMLDPSSMVFYTVAKEYTSNEYYTQPKINRQMFHWGEEKLVQGRLYPQSNDDDNEAYAPYRNIVQNIMSVIFDFPNLWTLHKGTDAASRYINSYGTHYRDYIYYSNCSLSRIKGSENEKYFDVGADPICINCGEEHGCSENINCCESDDYRCCDCCGERIYSEDDEYWVGDRCYCRECVTYCDYCEEWHHYEDVRYVNSVGYYVCNRCLDEYFTCCDDCDCYYHNDDIHYIMEEDRYVCDKCLCENYSTCEECGELYDNDNLHRLGDRYLCSDCYDKEKEDEEETEEEL